MKIRTTVIFNKDIPIEQLPSRGTLTKEKLKLSRDEQKDILTTDIDLPKKRGRIITAGPDIGGKVIIDPENPKIVDILTWNTSQSKPGEIYSHAEFLFINWAEGLPDPLENYVTRIDIYANEGPCELCIQKFPERLLEIFKNAKIEHYFEKPHMSAEVIKKRIEENPNNEYLTHLYGHDAIYLILHKEPDDRKIMEELHNVIRGSVKKKEGGNIYYLVI